VQSFTSVDPLAEKFPNVSSYVYCHDNPINKIDKDGRADENTGGKRSEINKTNGVPTAAQSATAGNQPREVVRPTPIKQLTPMQQAVKTARSQPQGEIKPAGGTAQEQYVKRYNELPEIEQQAVTNPVFNATAVGGGLVTAAVLTGAVATTAASDVTTAATTVDLTLTTTTTLKATAITFGVGAIEGGIKAYFNTPPDTPYLIPGPVFQNGSDAGNWTVTQFIDYLNSFNAPQSNQSQTKPQ